MSESGKRPVRKAKGEAIMQLQELKRPAKKRKQENSVQQKIADFQMKNCFVLLKRLPAELLEANNIRESPVNIQRKESNDVSANGEKVDESAKMQTTAKQCKATPATATAETPSKMLKTNKIADGVEKTDEIADSVALDRLPLAEKNNAIVCEVPKNRLTVGKTTTKSAIATSHDSACENTAPIDVENGPKHILAQDDVSPSAHSPIRIYFLSSNLIYESFSLVEFNWPSASRVPCKCRRRKQNRCILCGNRSRKGLPNYLII